MTTPTETVNDFLEMWAEPDGFARAVSAYFTPATVWENVGMVTTTGPKEALGFTASFAEQGISGFEVENLAVAETGNKVLTERIDKFFDASGKPAMAIRVMGIFEVENGKIVSWRDYFDTAGFASSQQG